MNESENNKLTIATIPDHLTLIIGTRYSLLRLRALISATLDCNPEELTVRCRDDFGENFEHSVVVQRIGI